MASTAPLIRPVPVTSASSLADISAHSLIKGAILTQMGVPPGMTTFKAHHTWKNHYRVDIYATKHSHSAVIQDQRIVESFFVTTNEIHEIVDCDPKIPQGKYFATNN